MSLISQANMTYAQMIRCEKGKAIRAGDYTPSTTGQAINSNVPCCNVAVVLTTPAVQDATRPFILYAGDIACCRRAETGTTNNTCPCRSCTGNC
jgi:hypothetical protein